MIKFSILVSVFVSYPIIMRDVKALKRENDELKKQISQISKDFKSMHLMKDKMTEKREVYLISKIPNENDVQFLSNGYDELVKFKKDIQKELLDLKGRLEYITTGVNRIDKAIDDMLLYSHQYNLKIVGVPQWIRKKALRRLRYCV
jgi:predicted  nucleic acid-binding Zn-ribbon protein